MFNAFGRHLRAATVTFVKTQLGFFNFSGGGRLLSGKEKGNLDKGKGLLRTLKSQTMTNVKPIPDGVSAVIPMLVCRDASAEVQFCKEAFGAKELVSRPNPDGTVAHAALTINGAMIMIEAEFPTLSSRSPQRDGSAPVVIYVYVEDVDAVVERAIAAGATVLMPVKTQFWGDRTGRIMDPLGHVWTISSRIEETSSDEREARWSSISKGASNKTE